MNSLHFSDQCQIKLQNISEQFQGFQKFKFKGNIDISIVSNVYLNFRVETYLLT